ncbi:MAG: hypothetical protein ACI87W_000668 [Halieaceae bacterium]|jgi:hypothetical protein
MINRNNVSGGCASAANRINTNKGRKSSPGMTPLRLLLVLYTSVWLYSASSANAEETGAKRFPGVQTLMSESEFREAGLGKLSAQELQALDRWLIRYTVGEAPVIRRENAEVREAEKAFNVEASITGDFRGWNGDTIFRLDNEQVWKQRLDGRFAYSGNDGRVRIERNFMGFFRLVHLDSGRAVGVTRLK